MKKLILTTLLLVGCTQTPTTPLEAFIKNFDTQTETVEKECEFSFGVRTLKFDVEIDGQKQTITTLCKIEYKIYGLTTNKVQTLYLLNVKGSDEILIATKKEIVNKKGILVPFQEYYDSN
jgi:hypothetical protein